MPLPIWSETHYSVQEGVVHKLVRCEKCQVEYVYEMKREAFGEGLSILSLDNRGAAERAARRAEEVLQRKLEKGFDLVPCPECGWYQGHMIPKARRQHAQWLRIAGMVFLALSAIPLIAVMIVLMDTRPNPLAMKPWMTVPAAVLGTLTAGCFLAKAVLSARYDPNASSAAERIRLGRSRAVLKEVFERRIAKRKPATGANEKVGRKATRDNLPTVGDHIRSRHFSQAAELAEAIHRSVLKPPGQHSPVRIEVDEATRAGWWEGFMTMQGLRDGGHVAPELAEKFEGMLTAVHHLLNGSNGDGFVPRSHLSFFLQCLTRVLVKTNESSTCDEYGALADLLQTALKPPVTDRGSG